MSVQATIEQKLSQELAVEHLEVVDESGNHNVPPGSESHFKVVVVAGEFEGKSLIARHQMVYRILDREMRDQIHALALHTYSHDDWGKHSASLTDSPACRGGSKLDRS